MTAGVLLRVKDVSVLVSPQAKTLDKEDVDTKLYTIFPAFVNKHVKQWYSPSSSYIQLSSRQPSNVSCGQTLPVSVLYSLLPDSSIQTFMYQVMHAIHCLPNTDLSVHCKQ